MNIVDKSTAGSSRRFPLLKIFIQAPVFQILPSCWGWSNTIQSGPGAGMLGDREDIAEKTGLEESDMDGNSPNCMVLDTWENLK